MQQPLIWIDLEMTGLDVEHDAILEIAVIVTDGNLENAIEGPDLIIGTTEAELKAMDPIVQNMHLRSGLWDKSMKSSLTVGEAERQVLAFVQEHVPEPGIAPLAGNSIHTDRGFLAKNMPALTAHLHYRIVDVSTLKELARRWMPDRLADAPVKQAGHRALADVRESIEELKYYRTALLRDPQLPQ